jgi:hypothetical protein
MEEDCLSCLTCVIQYVMGEDCLSCLTCVIQYVMGEDCNLDSLLPLHIVLHKLNNLTT